MAILMLLITSDVLGRYLFSRPIKGAIDLSEYVMIVAVYCSVAYCAVVKSHVRIDLIASRFPDRVRTVLDSATEIFSLALFSFMVWAATKQLFVSWGRGEESYLLKIPAWPFRTVFIIGIVMLCLVLLIDIIHLLARVVKR